MDRRKAIDGLGKGEVRVDNTVEDVAGNYSISFIIDCFLVAHCNSLYCMYPFVFYCKKILVSVLGHADLATLLGIHAQKYSSRARASLSTSPLHER